MPGTHEPFSTSLNLPTSMPSTSLLASWAGIHVEWVKMDMRIPSHERRQREGRDREIEGGIKQKRQTYRRGYPDGESPVGWVTPNTENLRTIDCVWIGNDQLCTLDGHSHFHYIPYLEGQILAPLQSSPAPVGGQ